MNMILFSNQIEKSNTFVKKSTQFHESSDEIQHQITLNLNRIVIVILFYKYYLKIKAFDLNS